YVSQVSEKLESKNVTDYRHIENVFRSAYNQIMPDSMQVNFTPTEYIHIGKFGVDACYEAGILLIERTYGKGGTIISYHLNPEVEDYIYSGSWESTMARIISSTYRRMICKPDRWESPYGGGYLSLRRKAQCGLIVHRQQSPKSVKAYNKMLDST